MWRDLLEQMVFYMVLGELLITLLPNENYEKYFRFFIQLVLCLLWLEPIWTWLG